MATSFTMPLTQGIDFISDTSEVERLARNVLVPADFTTDQVKSYQYKVYSLIRTLTDKDDWDSGDREFGALQLIETELAAEMIKKHYGDKEEVAAADASIAALMAQLHDIVSNLDTETTTEGGSVQVTDYKSWNLNPDVPVPNRLRNVGTTEIDF